MLAGHPRSSRPSPASCHGRTRLADGQRSTISSCSGRRCRRRSGARSPRRSRRASAPPAALQRLRFAPWFLYEPGRSGSSTAASTIPRTPSASRCAAKLAGSPVVGRRHRAGHAARQLLPALPLQRVRLDQLHRPVEPRQLPLLPLPAREPAAPAVPRGAQPGTLPAAAARRDGRRPDPEANSAARHRERGRAGGAGGGAAGLGERLRDIDALRFRGADTARAVSGMVQAGREARPRLGAGAPSSSWRS